MSSEDTTDSLEAQMANMSLEDTSVNAQMAAVLTALRNLGTRTTSPTSIRIPPFWSDDPELWFTRLEAQFETYKVETQKAKFNYVVQALDNATIQEVRTVARNPQVHEEYDNIKQALLQAFGRTQEDKDAALFALNGLGDRKPSSLFRYIDSLSTDRDTFVKAFFMAQLPSDVRAVLAGQNFPSNMALAEAADSIIASQQSSKVSEVTEPLVQLVNQAHINKKTNKAPFICPAHKKYGTKAFSCREGCLFADLPLSQSKQGNEKAKQF